MNFLKIEKGPLERSYYSVLMFLFIFERYFLHNFLFYSCESAYHLLFAASSILTLSPSVCLPVCLSGCLSVCLSGCVSVCLSVCLSVYLSLFVSCSMCLYVSLSLSLSLSYSLFLFLSYSLSFFLTLSLDVSLCMCVSLYIYLYLYSCLSLHLLFIISRNLQTIARNMYTVIIVANPSTYEGYVWLSNKFIVKSGSYYITIGYCPPSLLPNLTSSFLSAFLFLPPFPSLPPSFLDYLYLFLFIFLFLSHSVPPLSFPSDLLY